MAVRPWSQVLSDLQNAKADDAQIEQVRQQYFLHSTRPDPRTSQDDVNKAYHNWTLSNPTPSEMAQSAKFQENSSNEAIAAQPKGAAGVAQDALAGVVSAAPAVGEAALGIGGILARPFSPGASSALLSGAADLGKRVRSIQDTIGTPQATAQRATNDYWAGQIQQDVAEGAIPAPKSPAIGAAVQDLTTDTATAAGNMFGGMTPMVGAARVAAGRVAAKGLGEEAAKRAAIQTGALTGGAQMGGQAAPEVFTRIQADNQTEADYQKNHPDLYNQDVASGNMSWEQSRDAMASKYASIAGVGTAAIAAGTGAMADKQLFESLVKKSVDPVTRKSLLQVGADLGVKAGLQSGRQAGEMAAQALPGAVAYQESKPDTTFGLGQVLDETGAAAISGAALGPGIAGVTHVLGSGMADRFGARVSGDSNVKPTAAGDIDLEGMANRSAGAAPGAPAPDAAMNSPGALSAQLAGARDAHAKATADYEAAKQAHIDGSSGDVNVVAAKKAAVDAAASRVQDLNNQRMQRQAEAETAHIPPEQAADALRDMVNNGPTVADAWNASAPKDKKGQPIKMPAEVKKLAGQPAVLGVAAAAEAMKASTNKSAPQYAGVMDAMQDFTRVQRAKMAILEQRAQRAQPEPMQAPQGAPAAEPAPQGAPAAGAAPGPAIGRGKKVAKPPIAPAAGAAPGPAIGRGKKVAKPPIAPPIPSVTPHVDAVHAAEQATGENADARAAAEAVGVKQLPGHPLWFPTNEAKAEALSHLESKGHTLTSPAVDAIAGARVGKPPQEHPQPKVEEKPAAETQALGAKKGTETAVESKTVAKPKVSKPEAKALGAKKEEAAASKVTPEPSAAAETTPAASEAKPAPAAGEPPSKEKPLNSAIARAADDTLDHLAEMFRIGLERDAEGGTSVAKDVLSGKNIPQPKGPGRRQRGHAAFIDPETVKMVVGHMIQHAKRIISFIDKKFAEDPSEARDKSLKQAWDLLTPKAMSKVVWEAYPHLDRQDVYRLAHAIATTMLMARRSSARSLADPTVFAHDAAATLGGDHAQKINWKGEDAGIQKSPTPGSLGALVQAFYGESDTAWLARTRLANFEGHDMHFGIHTARAAVKAVLDGAAARGLDVSAVRAKAVRDMAADRDVGEQIERARALNKMRETSLSHITDQIAANEAAIRDIAGVTQTMNKLRENHIGSEGERSTAMDERRAARDAQIADLQAQNEALRATLESERKKLKLNALPEFAPFESKLTPEESLLLDATRLHNDLNAMESFGSRQFPSEFENNMVREFLDRAASGEVVRRRAVDILDNKDMRRKFGDLVDVIKERFEGTRDKVVHLENGMYDVPEDVASVTKQLAPRALETFVDAYLDEGMNPEEAMKAARDALLWEASRNHTPGNYSRDVLTSLTALVGSQLPEGKISMVDMLHLMNNATGSHQFSEYLPAVYRALSNAETHGRFVDRGGVGATSKHSKETSADVAKRMPKLSEESLGMVHGLVEELRKVRDSVSDEELHAGIDKLEEAATDENPSGRRILDSVKEMRGLLAKIEDGETRESLHDAADQVVTELTAEKDGGGIRAEYHPGMMKWGFGEFEPVERELGKLKDLYPVESSRDKRRDAALSSASKALYGKGSDGREVSVLPLDVTPPHLFDSRGFAKSLANALRESVTGLQRAGSKYDATLAGKLPTITAKIGAIHDYKEGLFHELWLASLQRMIATMHGDVMDSMSFGLTPDAVLAGTPVSFRPGFRRKVERTFVKPIDLVKRRFAEPVQTQGGNFSRKGMGAGMSPKRSIFADYGVDKDQAPKLAANPLDAALEGVQLPNRDFTVPNNIRGDVDSTGANIAQLDARIAAIRTQLAALEVADRTMAAALAGSDNGMFSAVTSFGSFVRSPYMQRMLGTPGKMLGLRRRADQGAAAARAQAASQRIIDASSRSNGIRNGLHDAAKQLDAANGLAKNKSPVDQENATRMKREALRSISALVSQIRDSMRVSDRDMMDDLASISYLPDGFRADYDPVDGAYSFRDPVTGTRTVLTPAHLKVLLSMRGSSGAISRLMMDNENIGSPQELYAEITKRLPDRGRMLEDLSKLENMPSDVERMRFVAGKDPKTAQALTKAFLPEARLEDLSDVTALSYRATANIARSDLLMAGALRTRIAGGSPEAAHRLVAFAQMFSRIADHYSQKVIDRASSASREGMQDSMQKAGVKPAAIAFKAAGEGARQLSPEKFISAIAGAVEGENGRAAPESSRLKNQDPEILGRKLAMFEAATRMSDDEKAMFEEMERVGAASAATPLTPDELKFSPEGLIRGLLAEDKDEITTEVPAEEHGTPMAQQAWKEHFPNDNVVAAGPRSVGGWAVLEDKNGELSVAVLGDRIASGAPLVGRVSLAGKSDPYSARAASGIGKRSIELGVRAAYQHLLKTRGAADADAFASIMAAHSTNAIFRSANHEPVTGGFHSDTEASQALKTRLGERVFNDLVRSKKLTIVNSASEIPGTKPDHIYDKGLYFSNDGKAYLIAKNLTPDTLYPTYLHEVGAHMGWDWLTHAQPNLVTDMNALPHAQAIRRALEASGALRDLTPTQKDMEVFAHMVEQHAKNNDSRSRGFVSRVLDAIKSWTLAHGWAKISSPRDAMLMAEGAARRIEKGTERPYRGPGGAMESDAYRSSKTAIRGETTPIKDSIVSALQAGRAIDSLPELQQKLADPNLDTQGAMSLLLGATGAPDIINKEKLPPETQGVVKAIAGIALKSGVNLRLGGSRSVREALRRVVAQVAGPKVKDSKELDDLRGVINAELAKRAKEKGVNGLTNTERRMLRGSSEAMRASGVSESQFSKMPAHVHGEARHFAGEDNVSLASEGTTDPEVQAVLRSIKVDDAKSAFGKLADSLAKVFGIDKENEKNAFSELVRITGEKLEGPTPPKGGKPLRSPGLDMNDILGRGMKHEAMESAAQQHLDEMEEKGESPKDVARKFWSDTYFKLPEDAQRKFSRMYEQHGEGVPDHSDLHDTLDRLGMPDNVDALEGSERGFVALMREANSRFRQAAPRPLSSKHVDLPKDPADRIKDNLSKLDEELNPKNPLTKGRKFVGHAAEPYALGLMQMDHIDEVYGKDIPPVRDMYHALRGVEAESAAHMAQHQHLLSQWKSYDSNHTAAQRVLLRKLMLAATFRKMYVDRAYHTPQQFLADHPWHANTPGAFEEYRDLHNKYAHADGIGEEGRKLYQNVADYYKKSNKETIDAAVRQIERETAPSDERDREVAKVKQLYKSVAEGPYFPLNRFGSHYVTARLPNGEQFNTAAETEAEAHSIAADLQKQGATEVRAGKASEAVQKEHSLSTPVLHAMYQKMKTGALTKTQIADEEARRGRPLTDEEKNDLVEKRNARLMETLQHVQRALSPEHGVLSRTLRRKYVEGASENMQRGLAKSMYANAHYIARLNNGDKVRDAMHAMSDLHKQARILPDPNTMNPTELENQRKLYASQGVIHNVHEELVKRYGMYHRGPSIESMGANIVNHANRMATTWLLTSSLSYPVINATQTMTMAYPHMAADTNPVTAAWHLGGALKDTVAIDFAPMVAGLLSGIGGHETASKIASRELRLSIDNSNLPPDEKAMLHEGLNRSMLDMSLMVDAAGVADPRTFTGDKLTKMHNLFAVIPHHFEAMNRIGTALGAYRMMKAKYGENNFSQTRATNYAWEVVRKSHFNYGSLTGSRYLSDKQFSDTNHGRLMGAVLRVLTQFKTFTLNASFRMARAHYVAWARKALHPMTEMTDDQVKDAKRASKFVAAQAAATIALAGISGLPFMDALYWMADGVRDVISERYAPAADTRDDVLHHLVGEFGPDTADALVHGVPSPALGVNLARGGFGNILPGLGGFDTKPDLHGVGKLGYDLAMGVPTLSLAEQARQAATVAHQPGRGYDALAYAAPKGARDAMLYGQTERKRSIGGAPAPELSPGQRAWGMAGFKPAAEANASEAKGQVMQQRQHIKDTSADITTRLASALEKKVEALQRGDEQAVAGYDKDITAIYQELPERVKADPSLASQIGPIIKQANSRMISDVIARGHPELGGANVRKPGEVVTGREATSLHPSSKE